MPAGDASPCLIAGRQSGFSLLELVAAAMILVIIAAIAIPEGSSGDASRLDSMAQQFAEAMRFARSEALRRGEPIAFRVRATTRKIKVKRVDTTTTPWSFAGLLQHPVSHKDYIVTSDATLPGLQLEHQLITIDGRVCSGEKKIWFDRQGAAWCLDPDDVAVREFRLTFSLGKHHRTLILDGPSGRVHLQ